MNVGDVIQRAIQEYYNNPGTLNDSLTPVMVAHWIEKSYFRYMGVFSDNNFGYFSSRENTLNITSASNVYTLPNGNTSTTQLSFSGTPVSGTYSIYVKFQNGATIASQSVSWNTTASALQTTLNALVSPNTIVITGGPAPTSFSINWGTLVTGFEILSPALLDANGNSVTITPVTTNLNVAFITAMAIRTGTAPNYQYQPLGTFYPNTKFGAPIAVGMGINQYVYGTANGPLSWCFEAGAPDPVSQLATQSVRFNPWPSQALTIVYDCIRYPNKIMYDNSSVPQPITTQELDLPRHFHDGVVMDVLIEAYIRMKADASDLIQLRDDFDKHQFNIELRNLQRQGAENIQLSDGGYPGWNG